MLWEAKEATRKRTHRASVRFTDQELEEVMVAMEKNGYKNREQYFRAMILNGLIININIKQIEEVIRLMSNATNNINQVAHRANETKSVHEKDVKELQNELLNLWSEVRVLTNELINTKGVISGINQKKEKIAQ